MKDNDSPFFQLIRSGLWGTYPDLSVFQPSVDWNEIYNLSRSQALLGVVMDGIDMLPEDLRPPRLLYLKWCADVLSLEDANHKLDKEVVNLFTLLRSNGIEPVLLKGQGVARNYIRPLHRNAGDIDIFIGKKNYEKVNQLLSESGTCKDKWSPKHMMYVWNGVIVENHRMIARMISPFTDRRLQKIVDKWHSDGDFEKVDINGYEVNVPPLEFNAMYLFLHSVNHLLGFGIGLRQLCDWSRFLHYRHSEIDKNVLFDLLKELKLEKAWKIFGALAVNYLGLPKEDLFTDFNKEDEKEAENLLSDILYNGNFGFSGERVKERPKGYFKRKLFNFKDGLERLERLRKIAADEVKWAPYMRMSRFVRGLFRSPQSH